MQQEGAMENEYQFLVVRIHRCEPNDGGRIEAVGFP
jgi:hypothetical protein